MTYREILDSGLSLAGEDIDSDYEVLLKKAVNNYYREALAIADADIEDAEVTLTTVADVATYGLPLYCKQALNFEDGTNDRSLDWLSRAAFRKQYPGASDTGSPYLAIPIGERGVQKQPAASGVLSITSSATSDTTPRRLIISGFSSGNAVREEVTLNGTTTVVTTNSYDASNGVRRLVVATDGGETVTGAITVTDSSSNTLAVIPPYYEASPTYQWFRLFPTPDTALTYTVECQRRKPPLIDDDDWPEIDEDYHELLVAGPAGTLLPNFGRTTAGDRYRTRYRELLTNYKTAAGGTIRRARRFANVMNRSTSNFRRPRIAGIDA